MDEERETLERMRETRERKIASLFDPFFFFFFLTFFFLLLSCQNKEREWTMAVVVVVWQGGGIWPVICISGWPARKQGCKSQKARDLSLSWVLATVSSPVAMDFAGKGHGEAGKPNQKTSINGCYPNGKRLFYPYPN